MRPISTGQLRTPITGRGRCGRQGIRGGRISHACHTTSTGLLLLGVPERIVVAIMGCSSASMAKRCWHVTNPMLHDVGRKIGGLLWGRRTWHRAQNPN